MSARQLTVLPDPDSPTIPSVRPRSWMPWNAERVHSPRRTEASAAAIRSWIARLLHRPDPGLVDMRKLVTPQRDMVSAMTGEWLDGLEAEAGYWYQSLRSPVEFSRAVGVLAGAGHGVFVEVSPHPVLAPVIAARRCVP